MKTKMKFYAILFLVCFSFAALVNDEPVQRQSNSYNHSDLLPVESRLMDANNVSTWFRNNGSFNRDPATGNSGFEWPKGSANYARYASGIWMACIQGSDTLTAVAEYAYDYLPGYVDDNGIPQGKSDPLYRIYMIERGDTTSPDYLNWPVSQGAYLNAQGKPFFLGMQTMFYVYTDGYPHQSGSTSLLSLKAQILQTNWNYINIGLKDVVFTEWRVINRSNSAWNNAYLTFWTDDDLGEATDDRIGCDTSRDLGFTYNATDNDPMYGTAPPAVGTKILRTPVVFTGNNNDTVRYYHPPGSQNLRVKVGYKYTGMNIFNTYNNTTPEPADPTNNTQTFRVISGLWRTGQSWVNPINMQTTTKVYSGDPVTGTGWNMTGVNDRRFLQSFGPFTMNPNDTQSVIFAQVIARGSSNLNSITRLRELSDHVQNIYNQNFQSVLAVHNISTEIPNGYTLHQNFPNPFNPKTIINYELPITNFVTLKVYNVLGEEVKTLVNEKQNAGKYEVDFDASALSSGIYFYKIETVDFVETKRMILLK